MPAHIYQFVPAAPPDPRRTITEAELPSEAGFGIARLTKLAIHPKLGEGPAVLGNHYHAKDRERFIVVEGYGVLYTQEIDGDGRAIGNQNNHPVGPDMAVVMEPFTAHTFVFDAQATMFCASTCTFDAKDMPKHELEAGSASFRAMMNLRAMVGSAGGEEVADRWEDIFYSFPDGKDGKRVVDLMVEENALTLDGEYFRFTDETLGEVLATICKRVGL